MNFMRSRRHNLCDVLQKTYDQAYQSSVHAILLETQNDQKGALSAWKATLQNISSTLADLEKTPPRTTNEQSYMSSILDIERQCHDRISYLEYRQYNNSPYSGFLPKIHTSDTNLIDFDDFDEDFSGAANKHSSRGGSGHQRTSSENMLQAQHPPTVRHKSESALMKAANKSSSNIQSRSHSSTSVESTASPAPAHVQVKPMVKTLRTSKPGKLANGSKAHAASKAAVLAWQPRSKSSPLVNAQSASMSASTTRPKTRSPPRPQQQQRNTTPQQSQQKTSANNGMEKLSLRSKSSSGGLGTKTKQGSVSGPAATTQRLEKPKLQAPIDVASPSTSPKSSSPFQQQQSPAVMRNSTVKMTNQMKKSSPSPPKKPSPKASPKPPPKPKNLAVRSQLQHQGSSSPPAKKVLVDDEGQQANEEVQETGDSAWDKRCAQIMKSLKGVDEHAAKQIVNEIVVKGDEVHWDDIAGLHQAKGSLKETVVYPFLRPDLFSGLREPARGMLLFGPPGTGKTMLARAVATESHSTFFSISASSLTSKFLGDSEKLVRALFYLAKQFAPSIIFVDEIDSLLSTRSDTGEHEASRRIKTEFLVQWSDLQRAAAGREDGGEDAQRVLVLAATNLPWAIDEAARRRFVRRQYIPLPERDTRYYQLYKLLSHQKHALSDMDMAKLLEMTEGFSGSDITALAKDAAMGPLRSLGDDLLTTSRDQIRPIMLTDFENSLKFIKPSVSKEGLRKYEEWALMYGSSGA